MCYKKESFKINFNIAFNLCFGIFVSLDHELGLFGMVQSHIPHFLFIKGWIDISSREVNTIFFINDEIC